MGSSSDDKYNELRQLARKHGAVERVVKFYRGEYHGANCKIVFKPFKLGAVTMENMCIISGYYDDARYSLNYLTLYQTPTFRHNHPHRKSHGEICSPAGHYMTEDFACGNLDNIIDTGLVYAMTANAHGSITITPGVFKCAVCHKHVWKDVRFTGNGGVCHPGCLKRCFLCGRTGDDTYGGGWGYRRVYLPGTGRKRTLCKHCQDSLREQSSVNTWKFATCVICRELVAVLVNRYGEIGARSSYKPCCTRLSRAIRQEVVDQRSDRRRFSFEHIGLHD